MRGKLLRERHYAAGAHTGLFSAQVRCELLAVLLVSDKKQKETQQSLTHIISLLFSFPSWQHQIVGVREKKSCCRLAVIFDRRDIQHEKFITCGM